MGYLEKNLYESEYHSCFGASPAERGVSCMPAPEERAAQLSYLSGGARHHCICGAADRQCAVDLLHRSHLRSHRQRAAKVPVGKRRRRSRMSGAREAVSPLKALAKQT